MSENKARGPVMGGHRGRGMQPGEKAKDFKGAMKRLFQYMERYKFRFVLMFIFAIAGTVFNIVGPKILGKATTSSSIKKHNFFQRKHKNLWKTYKKHTFLKRCSV